MTNTSDGAAPMGEQQDLLIARIAELEAERAELYEFLDIINGAGLRFNSISIKDALESIRKIGGSKFSWPDKVAER